MPKPLKTYRAHLGFYDTVVAAPSQKKALEAWGSSQDLFREGFATVTGDAEAVAAANAKPGVVLKRAAGSNDPFTENPAPPKASAIPKAKKSNTVRRKTGRARAEPPPEPPPDRSALERAENALAELKRERVRARKSFAERREALAADEARSERDFKTRERELSAAAAREKRAIMNHKHSGRA